METDVASQALDELARPASSPSQPPTPPTRLWGFDWMLSRDAVKHVQPSVALCFLYPAQHLRPQPGKRLRLWLFNQIYMVKLRGI